MFGKTQTTKGAVYRQFARVTFFITAFGLYDSVGGSNGFTAVTEVFPFRLALRTESRRFFFRFRRFLFGRYFREIAGGVLVLFL